MITFSRRSRSVHGLNLRKTKIIAVERTYIDVIGTKLSIVVDSIKFYVVSIERVVTKTEFTNFFRHLFHLNRISRIKW